MNLPGMCPSRGGLLAFSRLERFRGSSPGLALRGLSDGGVGASAETSNTPGKRGIRKREVREGQ